MKTQTFSLRRDRNGLRPVFFLGNELGKCPLQCKFCNLKNSVKVSSADNIRAFDGQYAEYSKQINEPYHPVIYNRGNVTHPQEFSTKTLNRVLNCFNKDARVKFVSINSREKFATIKLLDYLVERKLNYPIHFILGIESFSKNTVKLLGKNTGRELKRFEKKLAGYNEEYDESNSRKAYVFGLDVNLLFLPELYLGENEKREENFSKIREGIKGELRKLLELFHPSVPTEINVHPFCRVELLPFEDAGLDAFMNLLPELQKIIEEHNNTTSNHQTHLFIGVEGEGYSSEYWKDQVQKWRPVINKFNQSGRFF